MGSRKILIACYEIPGYGGANTASYQLFRAMQADGLDVDYVNLLDEQDVVFFEFAFGANYGNPQSLAQVHNCALKGILYGPHPELTELIDAIAPDVIVGVDFIAALLFKRAAPKKTVILLTAGCQQVKDAITGRIVNDLMTQERLIARQGVIPRRPCLEETEAADTCDLILTHSNITLALFNYFYPYIRGKIHQQPIWFGEWIYGEAQSYRTLAKPFAQRDIDVLFLASSWTRPEKNYPWVKRLISTMPGAVIHIVGEIREKQKLPAAHYHGLLTDRDSVFELMGRAKTVASPSVYDSAPGILFEAAAMGCNIVASKNCGNWMICHDELLVEPFDVKTFAAAVRHSFARKYEDNMQFFLDCQTYRKLTDIIEFI
jgi:glycosyltransferase involved in cell wall biosynthesis